ncbi:MAG: helical backbone metal receptor [Myxococcota bacterium]|nr:helical backbone metal receptor [Myxococcota bacterium]
MILRWFAMTIAASSIAACSRDEAAHRRPHDARRIVSLAPSITEGLFAVGAADRVVGRSRFCNFPPEARALPIVGDVEPDLEAILELRPDLVLGIGGLTSGRLAGKLEARGIPTWFPDASSLGAIDDLLLGLGERAGHLDDAKRLVHSLDAREGAIQRSVAGEPRPRVLMAVSLAPVVAAGPKSFAGELIRAAGGDNVVDDGGAWPTIGFERMVDLDPDIVLDATEVGTDDITRITPKAPGWGGLRAVREGHVVPVRDERVLRAGPRIADGLAVLARALHSHAAVP